MNLAILPHPRSEGTARIQPVPPAKWHPCTLEEAKAHFKSIRADPNRVAGWPLSYADPLARQCVFASRLEAFGNDNPGTFHEWTPEGKLWAAMILASALQRDLPAFMTSRLTIGTCKLGTSVVGTFFPWATIQTSDEIDARPDFKSADPVNENAESAGKNYEIKTAVIAGWHSGPFSWFEWPRTILVPSLDLYDNDVTEAGQKLIEVCTNWLDDPAKAAQREYIACWLHTMKLQVADVNAASIAEGARPLRDERPIDPVLGALIRNLMSKERLGDYKERWKARPLHDSSSIWQGAEQRTLRHEHLARGYVRNGTTTYVLGLRPSNRSWEPATTLVDDFTPISFADVLKVGSALQDGKDGIIVLKKEDLLMTGAVALASDSNPFKRFDPDRVLKVRDGIKFVYGPLPVSSTALTLTQRGRNAKINSEPGDTIGRVVITINVIGSEFGNCEYEARYAIQPDSGKRNRGETTTWPIKVFEKIPILEAWPKTTHPLQPRGRYYFYSRGYHSAGSTLAIAPLEAQGFGAPHTCFLSADPSPTFQVKFQTGDDTLPGGHGGYLFAALDWVGGGKSENSSNQSWVIGIDFGTTSTAVSLSNNSGGERFPSELVPCGTAVSESLVCGFEESARALYVGRNFIEKSVPNPTSTCIRIRESVKFVWHEPFLTHFILPTYPAGTQEGESEHVRESLSNDLKWSLQNTEKNAHCKAFLVDLVEIVLARLRAEGADPTSQVTVRFAYPSAFSHAERELLSQDIAQVLTHAATISGFKNLQAESVLPESLAVMKYFTKQGYFAETGGIYLDVGGGTTDICITRRNEETHRAELKLHSSIRYAGRWLLCLPLARAILDSKNTGPWNCFEEIRAQLLKPGARTSSTSESTWVSIIEAIIKKDPTLFGTTWSSLSANNIGLLATEVSSRAGALMYFLGVLYGSSGQNQEAITLCLAGNGSSIFGLLFAGQAKERENFFRLLFRYGVRRSLQADQGALAKKPTANESWENIAKSFSIEPAKQPKQEVAIGLSISVETLKGISLPAPTFLVGEDLRVNEQSMRFNQLIPDPTLNTIAFDQGMPHFVNFLSDYNKTISDVFLTTDQQRKFMIPTLEALLDSKRGGAAKYKEQVGNFSAAVANALHATKSGLPALLTALDVYWETMRKIQRP